MDNYDKAIRKEIREALKVFDKVYVISQGSKGLTVSPSKVTTGPNFPDNTIVGTVYANDVYSESEQILNYMNTFGHYPDTYKGVRDSSIVSQMMASWDNGAPGLQVEFDSEKNIVIKKTSFTAIGNGSSLTPYLGNTSWLLEDETAPLLIDCGSTVFTELEKRDLLLDKLNVIITHLHADNVGSLATLIEHYHYIKREHVKIYVASDLVEDLSQLLWIQGVKPKMYKLIGVSEDASHLICPGLEIQPFETKHVFLDYFKTFGWKLNYNGKSIIYSGDWREIPKDILKEINSNKFDELYLDVSNVIGNPTHIDIIELTSLLEIEPLAKMTPIHCDK